MSEPKPRPVKSPKSTRQRVTRAAKWTFLTGCLIAGVWSVLIEPFCIHTHELEIWTDRWPMGHPELRIAVIADTHTGAPFHGLMRLARVVDRCNALEPDLVLLAGDYIYHGVSLGSAPEVSAIAAVLGQLRAPLGVVAVLGNHDWWDDGYAMWRELEANGVIVLENQAHRIGGVHDGFWIVGIADLTERDFDLRGALAQVDDDAPVILLSHQPDIFPEVPDTVALTVAGHTHGGQVRLPFVPAIVPSRFGDRYVGGHVRELGRDLYVSRGLGNTGLPVRFGARPELPVLTLRSLLQ